MGYCRWNVHFIAFDELGALSPEFLYTESVEQQKKVILLPFRSDND